MPIISTAVIAKNTEHEITALAYEYLHSAIILSITSLGSLGIFFASTSYVPVNIFGHGRQSGDKRQEEGERRIMCLAEANSY